MPAIKETDLYPPLKAWLEACGYQVRAEVGGCDAAARRGDELVLVEIKRVINLDLLLQIARRQQICASVYAAVPVPNGADKRWRELTRLVKRLEAGLLLVHLDSDWPRVEMAFHPVRRDGGKKQAALALLTEMSGRSLDLNLGGSTRIPLMTAYREQALKLAAGLDRMGCASSPKSLRALGASAKAGAILYHNHYGWFERLGIGKYGLSDKGRAALLEYRELAEKFVFKNGDPGA